MLKTLRNVILIGIACAYAYQIGRFIAIDETMEVCNDANVLGKNPEVPFMGISTIKWDDDELRPIMVVNKN